MKIYKILMLVFFLIVLSNFASAYVDATLRFNRNDVEVLAYNCNDAGCNSVSPFSGYFDGPSHTTNGEVTIVFPSSLVGNGYAIYFYSPGMVPIAAKSTLHSYGNNRHVDVQYDFDFNQVVNCQSVIDEFSVTNDVYNNEPLSVNTASSLDAQTASAFSEKDNGVGYIPPHMVDRYYSADVRVDLEITRSGTVVNTQQQFFDLAHGNPIRMDEQADVHFSWTPNQEGQHTATVRSTVTDAQCSNNIQASSAKDFTVLPGRPTNECYTLLNSLDVNNHYPNVGEQLTFTFNKISNYANAAHALTPIPTRINYQIYEGSTMVDSGTAVMAANSNTVDQQQYSFQWTPTQAGAMQIVVQGLGESGMCSGLNNYQEELRLNFNVQAIPTYEIEFQVVDSQSGAYINNAEISLNAVGTQNTNAQGSTTFTGLPGNTLYSFTATHADYITHNGNVQVVDISKFHKFTMDPIANPRLSVTIDCFDEIVENHEQSCSAYVRANGQPLGNSNVNIRYDNGALFGSCTTDTISGGCEVQRIEDTIGTYTVRAEASANGYTDGVSDWFTYGVLRERYDIINLRVYNDPNFINEDYVFYRGEDMYVSFESIDTENNNVHAPNLVSQVTLVSTPGGRADLTMVAQGGGYYYYRLTPIPITHDFLGDSQAFAFVFNFTDESGGQEVVDLTILNNPPVINGIIPDQTLAVGETINVDLSGYASDIEDSGNDLTWSVSNVDTSIDTITIDNNNIEIVGVSSGTDTITFTLTDLDGDTDTQDVDVTVTGVDDLDVSLTCDYTQLDIGDDQTCTATVEVNGVARNNQFVEMRFDTGVLYGTCTTGASGQCQVTRTENTVGTYNVRAEASANGFNDGVSAYFTYDVVLNQDDLDVTISCFNWVIENHEQSCSAFVTSNGNPIGGASVEFRMDDNTLFGSCTTDAISGGCEDQRIETTTGNYTVRAEASATGYDDGVSSWFDYEVLRERYDIINLRVYNDSGFNNEDYVFYRGENMYVSFESIDMENNNVHVEDLVSQVTLVSTPGGRANLTMISQANGYYYYRLTPIPTTHEFLGDSQAFAFVFNFTDSSGGQEVVDLTILNNPPVIVGSIPDVTLEVGEVVNVDLSAYESDVEDSGNDLNWYIASGIDTGIADVVITNDILTVTGNGIGAMNVDLVLYDLDGDDDTQSIIVTTSSYECSDGVDNDGDLLIDSADPGCHSDGNAMNPASYVPDDDDETDPASTITFTNTPPNSAWVLSNYIFDLDATSSMGGTLHFYVIDAPSTFTIDESTGVIGWLPLPQDLGTQTITIMAADGFSSAYLTWDVNVQSRTNVQGEREILRNILNVMKIRFPSTPTVMSGDTLSLTITLENDGDFDQDNLRASVMSYDFGIKRMVGPFDLDKGESTTRTVYLDIPAGTPPGEYDIRIVMSNNDITRIKHRPIRVI